MGDALWKGLLEPIWAILRKGNEVSRRRAFGPPMGQRLECVCYLGVPLVRLWWDSPLYVGASDWWAWIASLLCVAANVGLAKECEFCREGKVGRRLRNVHQYVYKEWYHDQISAASLGDSRVPAQRRKRRRRTKRAPIHSKSSIGGLRAQNNHNHKLSAFI
jgi:hypothetical protein